MSNILAVAASPQKAIDLTASMTGLMDQFLAAAVGKTVQADVVYVTTPQSANNNNELPIDLKALTDQVLGAFRTSATTKISAFMKLDDQANEPISKKHAPMIDQDIEDWTDIAGDVEEEWTMIDCDTEE